MSEDACVCPRCGAVEGTPEWGTVGDGYDGYCPTCSDLIFVKYVFTEGCPCCGAIEGTPEWGKGKGYDGQCHNCASEEV
jgi:hypothetical protein